MLNNQIMNISKLGIALDRKFKKTLTADKYEHVLHKMDKMIGVIYGSVVGLLAGAATQPLGPQSAARAFEEKIPYTTIIDKMAMIDPVLGQLLIQLTEFKSSKWDSEKFKNMRNYLSVVINSSLIKVDLQPEFVEQIRMNKQAELYSLFSEDFYTRVPLCTFFGENTLTAVIGKIMQTHTSFDASAYGIIAASIIQMLLQHDNLFNLVHHDSKIMSITDWDKILLEKIIPIITQYHDLYCGRMFENAQSPKSEAEEKRIFSLKQRVENSYNDIVKRIELITQIYKIIPDVKENTDHMTEEQKTDYQITSIYEFGLNSIKLDQKHSSNPAILACWTVRTLQAINEKFNFDQIDPSYISRLIIRSVAVKTGCSAYNCMIVGAVLGAVFGFNQLPEEFYESMDLKLMDRINREIWEIIAVM